jgi:hypothetical protein
LDSSSCFLLRFDSGFDSAAHALFSSRDLFFERRVERGSSFVFTLPPFFAFLFTRFGNFPFAFLFHFVGFAFGFGYALTSFALLVFRFAQRVFQLFLALQSLRLRCRFSFADDAFGFRSFLTWENIANTVSLGEIRMRSRSSSFTQTGNFFVESFMQIVHRTATRIIIRTLDDSRTMFANDAATIFKMRGM